METIYYGYLVIKIEGNEIMDELMQRNVWKVWEMVQESKKSMLIKHYL